MALVTTAARISAVLALVGALTLSGGAAQAGPQQSSAPAQGPVQVKPAGDAAEMAVCGYYENAVTAFYNHCGSGHVLIYIDRTWASDYYWCIGPGNWDIGGAGSVSNAWYVGRTC